MTRNILLVLFLVVFLGAVFFFSPSASPSRQASFDELRNSKVSSESPQVDDSVPGKNSKEPLTASDENNNGTESTGGDQTKPPSPSLSPSSTPPPDSSSSSSDEKTTRAPKQQNPPKSPSKKSTNQTSLAPSSSTTKFNNTLVPLNMITAEDYNLPPDKSFPVLDDAAMKRLDQNTRQQIHKFPRAHATWRQRLNTPTWVGFQLGYWWIVDCWHHRVLYRKRMPDETDADLDAERDFENAWKTLKVANESWVIIPHSLATDGKSVIMFETSIGGSGDGREHSVLVFEKITDLSHPLRKFGKQLKQGKINRKELGMKRGKNLLYDQWKRTINGTSSLEDQQQQQQNASTESGSGSGSNSNNNDNKKKRKSNEETGITPTPLRSNIKRRAAAAEASGKITDDNNNKIQETSAPPPKPSSDDDATDPEITNKNSNDQSTTSSSNTSSKPLASAQAMFPTVFIDEFGDDFDVAATLDIYDDDDDFILVQRVLACMPAAVDVRRPHRLVFDQDVNAFFLWVTTPGALSRFNRLLPASEKSQSGAERQLDHEYLASYGKVRPRVAYNFCKVLPWMAGGYARTIALFPVRPGVSHLVISLGPGAINRIAHRDITPATPASQIFFQQQYFNTQWKVQRGSMNDVYYFDGFWYLTQTNKCNLYRQKRLTPAKSMTKHGPKKGFSMEMRPESLKRVFPICRGARLGQTDMCIGGGTPYFMSAVGKRLYVTYIFGCSGVYSFVPKSDNGTLVPGALFDIRHHFEKTGWIETLDDIAARGTVW